MHAHELVVLLEDILPLMLSQERIEHSKGVAKLAAELCRANGLDPERGWAAGLAHDMCKEMPTARQRELALAHPGFLDGSSFMKDKMLHGPAAAVLLAVEYGVEDAELLEAVALHTLGRPGMGAMATILYCADKLDPGRGHSDREFIQKCLSMPLKVMHAAVVDDTMRWLQSKSYPIADETRLLYRCLTESAVPE